MILHIWSSFLVNRIVTRIALWVCLSSLIGACLPVQAAEADLNTLLKGVEQRYNRAKTLQVHFVESYTVQGRARKSESGQLTLRKPGRMRWDYAAPTGKLFVSDGKDVYLYTPEAHRVEKTKLKASDDMRAPLAFLLGKLHFAKEFRNIRSQPEGSATRIVAEPKTDSLPYTRVEFVVGPDAQIHRVQVTGFDHSILEFDFEQEKLNPPLEAKLFQFRMPQGAQLVESAQ